MSKKLYWLVGLALVLTLGAIVYWKIEWPREQKATKGLSGMQVGKDDCEKAKRPFACYLDKAMAANDPTLCAAAGIQKRVNCLESYAEIKATEIDCSLIKDPEFKTECLAATKPATGQATEPESATTTPSVILPGLKGGNQ